MDLTLSIPVYSVQCIHFSDRDCYWQLTIEEKVIERAYKKLALDALVIQQGRLAEQKGITLFNQLISYN